MKIILYRSKRRQKDEEKETFWMFLVEQHDHEGQKIQDQAGNEDNNRAIQDLRGRNRNIKLDER